MSPSSFKELQEQPLTEDVMSGLDEGTEDSSSSEPLVGEPWLQQARERSSMLLKREMEEQRRKEEEKRRKDKRQRREERRHREDRLRRRRFHSPMALLDLEALIEDKGADSTGDESIESGVVNEDTEELSLEQERERKREQQVLATQELWREREQHLLARGKEELLRELEQEREQHRLAGEEEWRELLEWRDLQWELEGPELESFTPSPAAPVDLDWIFVITNFVLELPSAVFDQLSSVRKPQFALLGMLMSFAALFIYIVEFVYKCRKEKVTWKLRGTLSWLYYPSQKPFGSFVDIIGLVCAICQCVVATIAYNFYQRRVDNPIKISTLPIIFAFGLLCSKFLRDRRESRSTTRPPVSRGDIHHNLTHYC